MSSFFVCKCPGFIRKRGSRFALFVIFRNFAHEIPSRMRIYLAIFFTLLCGIHRLWAQTPTAAPTATIIAPEENAGELGDEEYQAPLTVRFESHAETEGWNALYEWRITKEGASTPILIRSDADLEYTFTNTGTWQIDLFVSFVLNGDTIVYDREPDKDYDTEHIVRMGPLMESPFSVGISDSQLEFPNAFSPNGDDKNDYLNVKQANTRSLVEFEANIFNRWGKHIYRWTDWRHKESGWDGTDHGRKCPDGAYYLHVKARGADGRHYNIKKTITLLTGYREDTL